MAIMTAMTNPMRPTVRAVLASMSLDVEKVVNACRGTRLVISEWIVGMAQMSEIVLTGNRGKVLGLKNSKDMLSIFMSQLLAREISLSESQMC